MHVYGIMDYFFKKEAAYFLMPQNLIRCYFKQENEIHTKKEYTKNRVSIFFWGWFL